MLSQDSIRNLHINEYSVQNINLNSINDELNEGFGDATDEDLQQFYNLTTGNCKVLPPPN